MGHTQGLSDELTGGVGPKDRTCRTGLFPWLWAQVGIGHFFGDKLEMWHDGVPGRVTRKRWGSVTKAFCPYLTSPHPIVTYYTFWHKVSPRHRLREPYSLQAGDICNEQVSREVVWVKMSRSPTPESGLRSIFSPANDFPYDGVQVISPLWGSSLKWRWLSLWPPSVALKINEVVLEKQL